MADWYVSSVAYTAIATFTASHSYAVGDIIRPTSPTTRAQYPQRCTTAGTSAASEPAWTQSKNGTTTSGTAVFTNICGQSTYGWSGAIGTLASLSQAANITLTAGDRVFVSSDHNENGAFTLYQMTPYPYGWVACKFISVNRAGSVPPVAADRTSGAVILFNANATFDAYGPQYWDGFTITQTANAYIAFNSSGVNLNYFKNCTFVFSNTGTSAGFNTTQAAKLVFDNTTVQFAATGQTFKTTYPFEIIWINTPSAIQGSTIPSTLFTMNGLNGIFDLKARGVDFSAITGTLVGAVSLGGGVKILFDSCKIASAATRYGTPSGNTAASDEVEFVNCYNGSAIISERYTPAGKVTTDTSTYMTGGAADDVGNFSLKMASNGNSDIAGNALETFWFDVENISTGSSKTATIQIVSSASLNNSDIKMILEYQSTSGSSLASFGDSFSNPLTTSTALTTSSQSWNSPPSTPVYQQLSITFTPQQAGRVRARVLLGKTSTTVWVNPQISIA